MTKPEARHTAFRDDAIELLKKHGGHLTEVEMLALASHLVGQIIAMQNQHTMTRQRAMEIVARNIEQGNSEVIEKLEKTEGSG